MQHARASSFRIDLAADLHQWRTFLAIAELGSLTRAAQFLGSHPSLLSRQLNALERQCGSRLFNRTGRGVALSEVGTLILPRVVKLLTDAQALEEEIRGEARAPSGTVTLGLLPSIAMPLAGRLYAEMRRRHPAVGLKIQEGSTGQIDEWLADARVDIGILYRYGASSPVAEEALATIDSYLVGAPGDALTAAPEVAFEALGGGLPFVLPGMPNRLRSALDLAARQHHVTLVPAIEAESLQIQKDLVEGERLYAVLPLHAVWNEVRERRLQAARIACPALQRTVSMAMAKSKGPGRAVAAVASLLAEQVDDMARAGMWRPGRPAP